MLHSKNNWGTQKENNYRFWFISSSVHPSNISMSLKKISVPTEDTRRNPLFITLAITVHGRKGVAGLSS
jgi:hypothetical protein